VATSGENYWPSTGRTSWPLTLFRRNLHEPEVITFDELLARAEWHVKLAENQAEGGVDVVEDDGAV